MSPSGHAEGSVDPFHRIRVASKIKQHLRVVEQGWILLEVSKQPKEKLSRKRNFTKHIMHAFQ